MATTLTDRYVLSPFDAGTAADRELLGVATVVATLANERVPEDPPLDPAIVVRRIRARPPLMEFTEHVARAADGELVGLVSVVRYRSESNQHLREVSVSVLPEHRRRSIARWLLAAAIASAPDDLVCEFWTTDRVAAGAAFLGAVGARQTLTMRTSQLMLAELDRAQVAEWARLDPPGYRLAWIDGDVPDELMRNVVAAYDAMNDAPRGDSAWEDWHTTPEEIRGFDRSRNESGQERRLVLAIDAGSGDSAGFTELGFDPRVPHVIQQRGTAVLPAHRGRGLGKWLKAVMLERALADWPAARVVRTGNAHVNAPMLAINTRLGFRRAWDSAIWEATVAQLRRQVEPATA
jgi:GNAT superfamily N-acetyltransferase